MIIIVWGFDVVCFVVAIVGFANGHLIGGSFFLLLGVLLFLRNVGGGFNSERDEPRPGDYGYDPERHMTIEQIRERRAKGIAKTTPSAPLTDSELMAILTAEMAALKGDGTHDKDKGAADSGPKLTNKQ